MKNREYPAIRGIQAGKIYYTVMVPLGDLEELFGETPKEVSPDEIAQRRLNEGRVPKIRNYIIENPTNYVFSSLAASMDGDYMFHPCDNNADYGKLVINDASFLLNDGQHRKAGIIDAISKNNELKNETISVVLFQDKDLSRSRQIFTDLNKNAVKASNSKSESFDSRDSISVYTQFVVDNIEFFRKYTDKETDNLGKNSKCLFTFHIFVQANKEIIGNQPFSNADKEFLVKYWGSVYNNMPLWKCLNDGDISKRRLKEDYIATQGVVIKALGVLGKYFYENETTDLDGCLNNLNEIDWSRGASKWRNRTIRKDGKILTNRTAILLTSNRIKKDLGITLDSKEKNIEKKI